MHRDRRFDGGGGSKVHQQQQLDHQSDYFHTWRLPNFRKESNKFSVKDRRELA